MRSGFVKPGGKEYYFKVREAHQWDLIFDSQCCQTTFFQGYSLGCVSWPFILQLFSMLMTNQIFGKELSALVWNCHNETVTTLYTNIKLWPSLGTHYLAGSYTEFDHHFDWCHPCMIWGSYTVEGSYQNCCCNHITLIWVPAHKWFHRAQLWTRLQLLNRMYRWSMF